LTNRGFSFSFCKSGRPLFRLVLSCLLTSTSQRLHLAIPLIPLDHHLQTQGAKDFYLEASLFQTQPVPFPFPRLPRHPGVLSDCFCIC
jgi:hypothetical protein